MAVFLLEIMERYVICDMLTKRCQNETKKFLLDKNSMQYMIFCVNFLKYNKTLNFKVVLKSHYQKIFNFF